MVMVFASVSARRSRGVLTTAAPGSTPAASTSARADGGVLVLARSSRGHGKCFRFLKLDLLLRRHFLHMLHTCSREKFQEVLISRQVVLKRSQDLEQIS